MGKDPHEQQKTELDEALDRIVEKERTRQTRRPGSPEAPPPSTSEPPD